MILDIQRFASVPSVYLEFKDLPNTETPIDAFNLNDMQIKIKQEITANSDDIHLISDQLARIEDDISPINIITNGSPVKTGRRIDGKDEYVIRYKIDGLNSIGDFEVPLGFTLSNVIITDMTGSLYSASTNWFPINSGVGSTIDHSCLVFCDNRTNGIKVRTYNENFTEAYINVHYIDRD